MRRRALLTAAAAGTTLSAGCLDGLDGQRSVTAYDCPPSGVDLDVEDRDPQVVCSHTVDPDEARVYALPSRTSVASVEDLEFTVYNDTDEYLEYGNWDLYRREDGEWVELVPAVWPDRVVDLDPNSTVTHSATVELEFFDVTPPVAGTFAATQYVEMPRYEPPIRPVVLFRVY